jgi:hypothetical protein
VYVHLPQPCRVPCPSTFYACLNNSVSRQSVGIQAPIIPINPRQSILSGRTQRLNRPFDLKSHHDTSYGIGIVLHGAYVQVLIQTLLEDISHNIPVLSSMSVQLVLQQLSPLHGICIRAAYPAPGIEIQLPSHGLKIRRPTACGPANCATSRLQALQQEINAYALEALASISTSKPQAPHVIFLVRAIALRRVEDEVLVRCTRPTLNYPPSMNSLLGKHNITYQFRAQ